MSITPLPNADFAPTMAGYSGQKPFRFWCQTVLPLVYDDSLSYYELLNKVVNYLNNTIADVASVEDNVDGLLTAYNQLQDYVNDYFSELDVQEEIDLKLDEMASSGALNVLIDPVVAESTGAWLNEHVNPVGSAVIVDDSLTIPGAAADAKVTGDLAKPAANLEYTNATAILANSDLNDYITAGNFRVTTSNAATLINAPESIGARLFVMRRIGTTTVNQIWVSERNMFFRGYTTGTWTNWKKCTADALQPYTDRVTATYATSNGWSTIDDLPVNRLYQIGNDLPASFGLADNSDYSSLYVLQANNEYSPNTWSKVFIQARTSHIWVKSGGHTWNEITNAAQQSYSVLAYDAIITADKATSEGWSSINDLPTNRLYQMGNDLPNSFGLADNSDYSSLYVLQANNGSSLSTWSKVFIQARLSHIWVKSGLNPWNEITHTVQQDYIEANSVLAYSNRVTADKATSEGWTSIYDLPVNRLYQMGNDLPESFGLADNSDYSSLYVLQANLGSSNSNWTKVFIQARVRHIWLKHGTTAWIDLTAGIYEFKKSSYGVVMDSMSSQMKIGLYGASIVAGQGVTGYNPFTGVGGDEYVDLSAYNYSHGGFYKYAGNDSWGAKFRDYVESMYPNTSVINWGIPGVSPSGYYTILSDANSPIDSNVDVAIISIGTNGRNNSEATNKTAFINIYNFFKAKGAQVFFLTHSPAFDNEGKQFNDAQIMQIMRSALDRYCPPLPVYQEVYNYCDLAGVSLRYDEQADKNFLTSDNLHPSNTGHDIIFKVVRYLLQM